MYPYRFVCLVVVLLSLTACKPDPLSTALRGGPTPELSNQILTEYCQTCHIHRTLNPSEHLKSIRTLYDRLPYTATTQCRACHMVSEDTWGAKQRKTIFPLDAAKNRYTAHERRFLQENPDLAKGNK